MSAVYYVELDLSIKNEAKARDALAQYLLKLLDKSPYAFGLSFTPDASFDEMINLLLAERQNNLSYSKHDGYKCWNSGFNASYSWSYVLDDAFTAIVPYLNDGSRYYQECEWEYDEYIIQNGTPVLKASKRD